MTKRFTIIQKEKGKYDNGISIKDTHKGVNYPMLDYGSAKDTEELLNELHEENQFLKQSNDNLRKLAYPTERLKEWK